MSKQEQELENKCKIFARSQGWIAFKNVPDGLKGIPDDTFVHIKTQKVIFVEFKTPTGRLSRTQTHWQNTLPALIHVVRTFDEFWKLLSSF